MTGVHCQSLLATESSLSLLPYLHPQDEQKLEQVDGPVILRYYTNASGLLGAVWQQAV